MIVLAGGDVVLPDQVLSGGTLVIDEGRIVAIEGRAIDEMAGATRLSLEGHTIVPGFIDVHVHGVGGHDVHDGPDAVSAVAAVLPRYGVTAFCPTSIACTPAALDTLLTSVASARGRPARTSARVLPAHLESNFISPSWKGAQPQDCLREFKAGTASAAARDTAGGFAADDILRVISARSAEVGVVTIAPEIGDGLDLVRLLRNAGHIVSIGHSGATYARAHAAIAAGVTHATHLFNRMSPLGHREPGVVGAVLDSPDVAAEIICDAFHVHPAAVSLALAVKGVDRVMAITDGTAGSGLPVGSRTRLGHRAIVVTAHAAALDDGTLAGSVLTMDGAFRMLVRQAGVSAVMAARLCATTPAAQLGLGDTGRLETGTIADVTVLDPALEVVQTFVRGCPALEH